MGVNGKFPISGAATLSYYCCFNHL